MTQSDLFTMSLPAALEGKRQGLEAVSRSNGPWLEVARWTAREVCSREGTVTADDVREVLYEAGIYPAHPNAWGAVFRCGFVWTGEWRVSAVPEGHGNLQRVWRVEGA